jgi:hypothetical protein
MNKRQTTTIFLTLTAALLISPLAASAIGAEQWAVFESSFASTKKYENPFTEVEVDVVFKQGEKQWKVPAFWVGDKKWTVRFAPPTEGKYTYRVECTDKANPDLNGKEQTLSVGAYTGDIPVIDFDMVGGNHDERIAVEPQTVAIVSSAYSTRPPMPVLVGETCYEGHMQQGFGDVQRRMFWGSILSPNISSIFFQFPMARRPFCWYRGICDVSQPNKKGPSQ